LNGGVVNVVEGLLPKQVDVLEWMAQYCPFHVSERSRVLLLASGFLQLVLSRGLFRGKRAAGALSLGLLMMMPFLHLGRAFDWHHAVLQGLLIVAFVIWRSDFCALSDGPWWAAGLATGFLRDAGRDRARLSDCRFPHVQGCRGRLYRSEGFHCFRRQIPESPQRAEQDPQGGLAI
jgi:hypothetical protein